VYQLVSRQKSPKGRSLYTYKNTPCKICFNTISGSRCTNRSPSRHSWIIFYVWLLSISVPGWLRSYTSYIDTLGTKPRTIYTYNMYIDIGIYGTAHERFIMTTFSPWARDLKSIKRRNTQYRLQDVVTISYNAAAYYIVYSKLRLTGFYVTVCPRDKIIVTFPMHNI